MKRLLIPTLITAFGASVMLFGSCADENSPIGSQLVAGDIVIAIDSLTLDLNDATITEQAPKYDARSLTTLMGRIDIPEYGNLTCSYVARMMSATNLNIPDEITSERVDSVKILLRIPREQITGDSLAPQVIDIYRMSDSFNSVLSDTVTNEFLPELYYDPADLLASKSYTLGTIGNSDIILSDTYMTVPVTLTGQAYQDFGPGLLEAYRNHPDAFEWPKTFAKYMPGLYIKPSFGAGCVANVEASQFMLYYHTTHETTEVVDNEVTTVEVVDRDSVSLISSAPEVLSTSRIIYKPSENIKNRMSKGEHIITTPGGYQTRFRFPASTVLKEYLSHAGNAAMITNLIFSIPAEKVDNDYNIGVPPYLLMIRSDKVEEFFANSSLPDGETSFWAAYTSSTGQYDFTSMRQYALNLAAEAEKDGNKVEDTEFVIIPVDIEQESVSTSSGTTTMTVTSCTPYLTTPRMCRLKMDSAKIVFTYTNQFNN